MKKLTDIINDEEKSALYVTGLLHEANQRGWIKGGDSLTTEGLQAFYELIADGFQPDKEVMCQWIKYFSADQVNPDYVMILLKRVEQDLTEWPEEVDVKS